MADMKNSNEKESPKLKNADEYARMGKGIKSKKSIAKKTPTAIRLF